MQKQQENDNRRPRLTIRWIGVSLYGQAIVVWGSAPGRVAAVGKERRVR
jgi:hypothetical protein